MTPIFIAYYDEFCLNYSVSLQKRINLFLKVLLTWKTRSVKNFDRAASAATTVL